MMNGCEVVSLVPRPAPQLLSLVVVEPGNEARCEASLPLL